MAVIVVVQDEEDVTLETDSVDSVSIEVTQTQPEVFVNVTQQIGVVEVLAGQPGLNNVHVGDTPPAVPQEDFIWVDTSGL
jgi:hypothetical protein